MSGPKFDTHAGWTIQNRAGHRRAYVVVVMDPEDGNAELMAEAFSEGQAKLVAQLADAGFEIKREPSDG